MCEFYHNNDWVNHWACFMVGEIADHHCLTLLSTVILPLFNLDHYPNKTENTRSPQLCISYKTFDNEITLLAVVVNSFLINNLVYTWSTTNSTKLKWRTIHNTSITFYSSINGQIGPQSCIGLWRILKCSKDSGAVKHFSNRHCLD